MIISASVIKKPRRIRRCENCEKPIEGVSIRLFGRGGVSRDRPHPVYVHPRCVMAGDLKNARVATAVAIARRCDRQLLATQAASMIKREVDNIAASAIASYERLWEGEITREEAVFSTSLSIIASLRGRIEPLLPEGAECTSCCRREQSGIPESEIGEGGLCLKCRREGGIERE